MPKATAAQQDARIKRYLAEAFRKYGITETQFRALWAAQGGRCYICQRPFKSKLPAIDHDHETQFVRGLLCGGSFDAKTCNRLIGFHSADNLERAAQYMRNPPAFAVIGRIRPGTMEKAS
jgi:hypothetical protein